MIMSKLHKRDIFYIRLKFTCSNKVSKVITISGHTFINGAKVATIILHYVSYCRELRVNPPPVQSLISGTSRCQNMLKVRIGGFWAHIFSIKKSDSRYLTKIFEIFENFHPKWRPRGSKNRWCIWTIHTSFWS